MVFQVGPSFYIIIDHPQRLFVGPSPIAYECAAMVPRASRGDGSACGTWAESSREKRSVLRSWCRAEDRRDTGAYTPTPSLRADQLPGVRQPAEVSPGSSRARGPASERALASLRHYADIWASNSSFESIVSNISESTAVSNFLAINAFDCASISISCFRQTRGPCSLDMSMHLRSSFTTLSAKEEFKIIV